MARAVGLHLPVFKFVNQREAVITPTLPGKFLQPQLHVLLGDNHDQFTALIGLQRKVVRRLGSTKMLRAHGVFAKYESTLVWVLLKP